MTDLEIIRKNACICQIECLKILDSILAGKKNCKVKNVSAEYKAMKDAMYRLFGVEKTHETKAEKSKRITEGTYKTLLQKRRNPYDYGFRN